MVIHQPSASILRAGRWTVVETVMSEHSSESDVMSQFCKYKKKSVGNSSIFQDSIYKLSHIIKGTLDCVYTVKPAHEVISIKSSPVLKGHF